MRTSAVSAATGTALRTYTKSTSLTPTSRRTSFCQAAPMAANTITHVTPATRTTSHARRRGRAAGSHFVSRRTIHAASAPKP